MIWKSLSSVFEKYSFHGQLLLCERLDDFVTIIHQSWEKGVPLKPTLRWIGFFGNITQVEKLVNWHKVEKSKRQNIMLSIFFREQSHLYFQQITATSWYSYISFQMLFLQLLFSLVWKCSKTLHVSSFTCMVTINLTKILFLFQNTKLERCHYNQLSVIKPIFAAKFCNFCRTCFSYWN